MAVEKTLSSQSIFKGSLLGLRVDQVGLSSGKTTSREIVNHRPSVTIIPLTETREVLLVNQFRYPVKDFLLETPAGMIEDKESPEECAQRELQEEVGQLAGRLLKLGDFWTTPGFCDQLMHVFLAEELQPSILTPDEDEDITVVPVSVANIPGMIAEGVIRDAKTIAALLMADL